MYNAAAERGGVTYKVMRKTASSLSNQILLPSVREVLSTAAASHWPSSYEEEGSKKNRMVTEKFNFSGRHLSKEQWSRLLQAMRQRACNLGDSGDNYANFVLISVTMGMKIPTRSESFRYPSSLKGPCAAWKLAKLPTGTIFFSTLPASCLRTVLSR